MSAVVAAVLIALALAPPALAEPVAAPVCTPDDPGLSELSGLAGDARRWFALSDGGTRLRVSVLDPVDCGLLDVVTNGVDPYDVEDLALAADGALWLADIGDNDRDRRSVALHRLTRDGAATVYRLTYPDGAHDAEALLLGRDGVPYVVTKEVVGEAGVYRPSGPLRAPGPTPLTQVAAVRISGTDTPGGPLGRLGSVLVTGGAVSADGRVVALRTYTDAYLFAAPDGDVAAALRRAPVRIPLPGEPAGEALALLPDGTLLSGSEGGAPIRAVPHAVALVALPPAAPPVGTVITKATPPVAPHRAESPPGTAAAGHADTAAERARWKEVVVACGLVGMLLLIVVRSRGRTGRAG